MKVLRSTLVIGLAAFAAACGDKVTVAGPPASDTAPRVNSVTVTPGTAVMAVGQTVNFTAAVDASNGAATTVTWSSSDNSKVSVSASGTATAVAATPGVAICATSTVTTSKVGCASVTVTAAPTTTPPSISISAVNFTNGAGVQQPAPVPPGAVGTAVGVGPQLNVVMNVNAGTAILDSVVLRVGGKTAYKQAFSASQQAALLAAANGGDPAAQTSGTTITGSFNTADYCASTNANTVACAGGVPQGTPTYLNGNQTFQALIFGKQSVTAGGSPTNTQGQSPVSTYRFANLNGFHITMSFGNGTNTTPTAPASSDALVTATDLAGFKWVKGQPSVSALFVAYTPGLSAITSVISTTATINALGCSAGGARTIQLTNTSSSSTIGPWTGTWVLNTTPGAVAPALPAVNVNGYEWNPAAVGGACGGAAFTAGGDIVNFAAIGSDGNAIPLAAGVVPAGFATAYGVGVLNTFANSNNPDPATTFRLDNVAPPAPTVQMQSLGSTATTCVTAGAATDLGNRTNCWFNNGVQLAGLSTGTGNAWGAFPTSAKSANGVILSGADLGSGRIIAGVSTVMSTTFQARADLATTPVASIDGNSAIATVAGLADSPNNSYYLLRIRSTDLMGNTRQTSSQAGVPFQFGVDNVPPTLSLLAGVAHGTRIYATPAGAGGTNYNLLPTDPSTLPAIGSGFFALAAQPLTTRQTVTNAAGVLVWCGPGAVSPPLPVVGATGVYQTAGTTCTSSGTTLGVAGTSTGSFRTNLTYSDTHASVLDGYYASTNTITDQAGNVSAPFVLLQVDDGTNATWGGLAFSPGIIPPGGNVTFSATLNDNVDIQAARLALGVGTNGAAAPAWGLAPFDPVTAAAFAPTSPAGGATFWQYINGADLQINPCAAPLPQPAATCTTAPATLVSNTTASYPINGIFTNVQVSAAATGAGPYTYNVGNNLMNATGFAFNQGVNIGVTPLNAGMATTVGISLGAVSPAVAALNGGGGNTPTTAGPANWVVCAVSTTGLCASPLASPPTTGGGTPLTGNFNISVSGAGGLPTNVNITAVAEGTTAIFQNPFSSVQFYVYEPSPGLGVEGWRLIGTLYNATATSDLLGAVPNGRNWYFTMNWTPNATTAPFGATNLAGAVYRVMAIGIANATHTGPPSQVGAAVATPLGFTTVTVVP